MKRDSLHIIMLLMGFVIFIFLQKTGSEYYFLPLGIGLGLGIQYIIDDYYANKQTKQRGKDKQ